MAARVALAARGAFGRIAGFDDKFIVVAARPVEADIGAGEAGREREHHHGAEQNPPQPRHDRNSAEFGPVK